MKKNLFTYWQTKFRLLLLITFLTNLTAIAQTSFTVDGIVNEKELNSPLPGVNVIIKGTQTGTVTDFDGKFKIDVKEGTVLEFSSIGFKNQIVVISDRNPITILMEEDKEQLNEVVVVGYGTQNKKNLTGSIVKIGGKVIENRAVSRVEQALTGRVAGVRVQTSSSEAGADPRIVVRGQGSITGSSSPLIVVDGVALGTDPDLLGTIDSNNIDSIEVLKDASSVAIFGSRGANGVIIVSLKKGVAGETKFNYNTYTGFRYVQRNDNFNTSVGEEQRRLDSFDVDELARFDQEIRLPAGSSLVSNLNTAKSRLAAQRFIANANGGETDWQDVILPGGVTTSHSFSALGGSENTKFSAAFSYLEDGGISLKDDFKRYNGRIKIDSKTANKKIRYGAVIRGTYTEQERLPTSLIDVLRQSRFLPTALNEETINLINRTGGSPGGQTQFSDYEIGDTPQERAFNNVFTADGNGGLLLNPDGTVNIANDGSGRLGLSTTNNENPFNILNQRSNTRDQARLQANTYIEFKLAKGLSFRQSIGGDYVATRAADSRGLLADEERIDRTRRRERVDTRAHYVVESLLKYKRNFGNHSFDSVLGFSFDEFDYTTQSSLGEGVFSFDETRNIPLSANAQTFTLLGSENLVSYFGRLNYDYDDKYLVSLSARRDGSSRFGSDRRYGFFPAASVGWRISNESFLAESNVITDLKLRASYGISGSNEISSSPFNSLFRSQSLAQSVNAVGLNGFKRTAIENRNLGWEQLIEFNPGVDLEFGNGILGITFDYYERTSEDLILDLQIPSVVGTTTQIQNIGEVENSGYEVVLRSRLVNNKNLKVNVSGQFNTNENKVVSLGNNQQQRITAINDSSRPVRFAARVGEPISQFFGFVFDRDIPIQFIDRPFERFDPQTARVFVKDLNGDGVITDDDRTVLGDNNPDFEWGFNTDIEFHNFDFSFALQGSYGAQVRVADLDQLKFASEPSQQALGDIVFPEEQSDLTVERRFTSAHIQDASFIALRNVSLGYTLPRELTQKFNINKVRVYASGENLVYLTDSGYQGFNPEAARFSESRRANTPLTLGYQRGDLPIARTITFGLNLQF